MTTARTSPVPLIILLTVCACSGGGGNSSGALSIPSGNTAPNAPTSSGSGVANATPPANDFAVTSPIQSLGTPGPRGIDPADVTPVTIRPSAPNSGNLAAATFGTAHVMPLYHSKPIQLDYTSRGAVVKGRSRLATVLGFPSDLLYYGGAIVGGATVHNIYVSSNYINCGTTCWGNVAQFENDLFGSNFISLSNQYVARTAANRYVKGQDFTYTYYTLSPRTGQNPVMGQSDITVPVYYAASQNGAGYGHIYNVFLPPNTDTCFDQSPVCYSPDNPNTFSFCGYHSSFDVPGFGHILYSVLPYAQVSGCSISSDLTSATGSVLLHETFETLTDPDPPTGWYNPVSNFEIADLCQLFGWNLVLSGDTYHTQIVYSDADHACSTGP